VRLIRKAAGVPVFAHPGLADRDALIPGLISAGMMGIECYYTEHSAAQRASYVQICHDHDLVATGGSDFHGPKVRAATLGSPAVPMSTVVALRVNARLARRWRNLLRAGLGVLSGHETQSAWPLVACEILVFALGNPEDTGPGRAPPQTPSTLRPRDPAIFVLVVAPS
jgi:hypothetical protein